MEINLFNYEKKIDFIPFLFVWIFVKFLQCFSFKNASNLSGFIGKYVGCYIGCLLGENRKIAKNLNEIFPKKTKKEINLITKNIYENIGRFIGEYVNLYKIDIDFFKKNLEIIGEEEFIKNSKNGCFIMSGHYGNWEIGAKYLQTLGLKVNVIYKPQKNYYINKLYLKQRDVNQIPKENNALKTMLHAMKTKEIIAILIDQRDKHGELYKFFNKDARTSTAIQRLSVKYKYPIISSRCYRTKDNPNKFILEFYSSYKFDANKNIEDQIYDLTNSNIKDLEKWILENPEQWLLWFYSRWKINFK